jgi:hypothetical protein
MKKLWLKIKRFLGMKKFLCDTCRYDYPSACLNPKRPNATECTDYQRR